MSTSKASIGPRSEKLVFASYSLRKLPHVRNSTQHRGPARARKKLERETKPPNHDVFWYAELDSAVRNTPLTYSLQQIAEEPAEKWRMSMVGSQAAQVTLYGSWIWIYGYNCSTELQSSEKHRRTFRKKCRSAIVSSIARTTQVTECVRFQSAVTIAQSIYQLRHYRF